MNQLNPVSLDQLCATLCYAMGLDAPKMANMPIDEMERYLDEKLSGRKCDRVFMYNPDAIAQWLLEKYPELFKEVTERCEYRQALRSVMPSVTPVCFGTMYTGAQPSVHGILRYEKPVITIDTIFDALIRAGKKSAIIAYGSSSLRFIYQNRDMDYFIFNNIEQVNAKAMELISKDEHDFIVVYNGNYDSAMHKNGPEGIVSLCELRCNVRQFGVFYEAIKENWKEHTTLIGFAMDHGCHEIDEGSGSHGLDMPEDLNITHFYQIL